MHTTCTCPFIQHQQKTDLPLWVLSNFNNTTVLHSCCHIHLFPKYFYAHTRLITTRGLKSYCTRTHPRTFSPWTYGHTLDIFTTSAGSVLYTRRCPPLAASLCPQPSVAARHDLTPPSLAGVYHFLSTVARWNSNRNMFASAELFLSDEDDDAVWACSWSTAERLVWWWWWWWWWCCGCAGCCIPALISAETDGRERCACAVISTTLYKVWCTDTVIMRVWVMYSSCTLS